MMSNVLPATMKSLRGASATLTRSQPAAAMQMSSKSTICDNSSAAAAGQRQSTGAAFHRTAQRDYPQAEPLPLPPNIDLNESTRFSPQRHRDLNATILAAQQLGATQRQQFDITVDQSRAVDDAHIGRYDCQGAVSLRSSMQSNVPSPFGGMHKFTHLNMPGGQYGQGIRLVASDQQQSHYYTNLRQEARRDWAAYDQNATVSSSQEGRANRQQAEQTERLMSADEVSSLLRLLSLSSSSSQSASISHSHRNKPCSSVASHILLTQRRACLTQSATANNSTSVWHAIMSNRKEYSTRAGAKDATAAKDARDEVVAKEPTATPVPLSRGEQLKKAVKEYGSTVIIFHVSISLLSLGTCYALVSSGLDFVAILHWLGWGESQLAAKLEAGGGALASTFVVAYAVHKCFAPVRISITLGATPFIVRYLRRRGFLKAVKPTPTPPTPSAAASTPTTTTTAAAAAPASATETKT